MQTSRTILTVLAISFFFCDFSFGMYNQEMGRFMQRDPLGITPSGGKQNIFSVSKLYADSLNAYEYVKSNALKYFDSLGLECGLAKYEQKGIPHQGLLVDGTDIDYGPVIVGPVEQGECPFNGNGGRAKDTRELRWARMLYRSKVGLMNPLYGTKRCSCATCDDIKKCLNKVCETWNSTLYGVGTHDCQGFVSEVIQECCLTDSP